MCLTTQCGYAAAGHMFTVAAAVFSTLLIVTGIAKVLRPDDVARALSEFGLPQIRWIGRSVGLIEVVVGMAALTTRSALAAQAAMYAVFLIWVVAALMRDVPLASCGCLGRPDTPPTTAHALLNGIAVATSLGAFWGDYQFGGELLAVVAQLGVTAVGTWLCYLVLTEAAYVVGVRSR